MIYKYYLNAYVPTDLSVPEFHQILAIQRQDTSIYVWIDVDYWVDPDTMLPMTNLELMKTLTFYPIMTGDSPEEGMLYIDTIQTQDGLVVHYYV